MAPCGKKGEGLLAGVRGRGRIVFKKGQKLGRLVGDFVAPKTRIHGYGFELQRKDLDGNPVVAQIYTGARGNEFGKVNHACGDFASATVQCLRVSGRYETLFYARRDICDGEEITVDWGPGHLQGKECLCVGCVSDRAVGRRDARGSRVDK